MKKFFTLIVLAALCGASNLFAQNQLVATLKHGDTTTLFYGSTALQQAHDAAEDGDVITLSEGTFLETTISKAVSIRGAGMYDNLSTGTKATNINKILFSNGSKGIIIEGLNIIEDLLLNYESYGNMYQWNNINDVQFIKCKLRCFTPGLNSVFSFINCIITNLLRGGEDAIVNVLNSIVINVASYSSSGIINFINSVVGFYQSETQYNSFRNSIIYETRSDNGAMTLPATVTSSHSLGINALNDRGIFDYIPDNTNMQVLSFADVFKTFSPTITGWGTLDIVYSDSETFELTDEAAAKYLGDDGKQVGIYGGDYPFTTQLSYPQATSVNVAKKTVDGKLAVDIKFNGAE